MKDLNGLIKLTPNLKTNRSHLKEMKMPFDSSSNKLSSYWRSEESETLKDMKKKTQNKSGDFLSDMNRLERKMNALSNSLKRADRESMGKK